MYRNIINGILGIVVVGVAFADFTGATLTWTLAIAGVIIAISSFWGLVTDEGGSGQHKTQQRQM